MSSVTMIRDSRLLGSYSNVTDDQLTNIGLKVATDHEMRGIIFTICLVTLLCCSLSRFCLVTFISFTLTNYCFSRRTFNSSGQLQLVGIASTFTHYDRSLYPICCALCCAPSRGLPNAGGCSHAVVLTTEHIGIVFLSETEHGKSELVGQIGCVCDNLKVTGTAQGYLRVVAKKPSLVNGTERPTTTIGTFGVFGDTGKTTAVDGQSGMFAAMVPDRDGSSQKYAQILQDKIDACMSMSSAKMGAVATAIAVPTVPSDMIRGAQMSESSQKTPTERLTEAKKLLDAGLITQDMYEEKQRVILGEV